jgi:hypothetical protein
MFAQLTIRFPFKANQIKETRPQTSQPWLFVELRVPQRVALPEPRRRPSQPLPWAISWLFTYDTRSEFQFPNIAEIAKRGDDPCPPTSRLKNALSFPL